MSPGATTAQSAQHDPHDPPPEYTSPTVARYALDIPPTALNDIPSEFFIGTTTRPALVSPSSVVAHLRLLGAFHHLEYIVYSRQDFSDPSNPPCVVRWRVFVHQAVWRFEVWLKRVIKPRGVNGGDLREEEIPPLDVLLVWHAYLLNPRVYADDTKRIYPELGALRGLPLESIAEQINPATLEFVPTPAQTEFWQRMTLTPPKPLFLSLSSRDELTVECPRCGCLPVQVSWLRQPILTENGNAKGVGWCQNDFSARCWSCGLMITRESMAVGHFAADIAVALTNRNAVLPGTLYDPRTCTFAPDVAHHMTALLLQPYVDLIPTKQAIGDTLDWSYSNIVANVGRAREMLAVGAIAVRAARIMRMLKVPGMSGRGFMIRTQNEELRARVLEAQEWLVGVKWEWRFFGPRIGKMLASYRDNPTPFSLDLVSAIIRQTSFTSKAFKLGWFAPSNPTLPIAQSIKRYHNFLHLLSQSNNFLVPTLDIDLSWHTHQLMGERYIMDTMWCVGRFVDHDDRVEEGVLSDGFDTTSREWKRVFNTPYSSCNYMHRSPAFSKIKNATKLIMSSTSTTTPAPEVQDLNTYPSEHQNTIVINDKTVTDQRIKRERLHARDHSFIGNEVPFVRRMNVPAGNGPPPGLTFGALGLAGWALTGDFDQSVMDAKMVEKGQCCAGYGMSYYGGPLWVGNHSSSSGGWTSGGCSAGTVGGCGGGNGGGDGGGDGGGCGGGCGG